MSLQRILFAIVAAVVLIPLVPGGVALEQRVSAELELRSREDMLRMPRVLAARQASAADAMMMNAKDLAGTPGLAAAVERGDRASAIAILERARTKAALGHQSVIITPTGAWTGPHPGAAALEATKQGKMPVTIVSDGSRVMTVGISPIHIGDRWLGAGGYAITLDSTEAGILSGLTRADVIVRTSEGHVAASTLDERSRASIVGALSPSLQPDTVHEVLAGGRRFLVAPGRAGAQAIVFFVRDLDAELAVVPRVRRLGLLFTGAALLVALILGGLVASALARPAQSLATAADRLAAGDFSAPVSTSRVHEFDRLARAFHAMREALAKRVSELESANRELAERQHRLAELQGELVQRDRLATAGQLVSQLAHEIRNPVANIRNCLELLRRRLSQDEEGHALTDMAIDELLRMHELAERLLDLHRPSAQTERVSNVAAVAEDVSALVRLGGDSKLDVSVTGERTLLAGIPPDSLKQVLLIMVQNARDAMKDGGTIQLDVHRRDGIIAVDITDSGPGIPAEVLPRVFDPFFTTKGGLQGVGLGLFVAEGIVRSHGGRVLAGNAPGGGARFQIELPAVTPQTPEATLNSQRGITA